MKHICCVEVVAMLRDRIATGRRRTVFCIRLNIVTVVVLFIILYIIIIIIIVVIICMVIRIVC